MNPNEFFGPWLDNFGDYVPGLWVSVKLTLASLLVGLPIGLLLATLTSSRRRSVRWATVALIEVGRGTPGLIMLYLMYFGLPQVGVTLEAFTAAALGLGFTTGAYTSEIFRAGINSVERGQSEAAKALSLSPWSEFRLITLPQALRRVAPPLVGWAILLFQGTSLAYAISVPELLSRAYNVATLSYQFGSALALAGVMYAAISLAGVILFNARFATAPPS
ncbi:amino acid ABC transporter permease [Aeromicrobium sp. P5_D10]